jgi:hypothetical protein
MPDITITFQEEGDEHIGFRIPAAVAEKMDAFIAERNANAVLGGPAYAGKADWFTKECYFRILKPVLDRFPDPPPEEAQLKLSQAAVLQQEAAQTIGYGHTEGVSLSDPPISREAAAKLLEEDLAVFASGVARLLTVPVKQNQFDALVSFAYNVGLGNPTRSSNDTTSGASSSRPSTRKAGVPGSRSHPAQMDSSGEPPMLSAPAMWPPRKSSIERVSTTTTSSVPADALKAAGGRARGIGRRPSTSGPAALICFIRL